MTGSKCDISFVHIKDFCCYLHCELRRALRDSHATGTDPNNDPACSAHGFVTVELTGLANIRSEELHTYFSRAPGPFHETVWIHGVNGKVIKETLPDVSAIADRIHRFGNTDYWRSFLNTFAFRFPSVSDGLLRWLRDWGKLPPEHPSAAKGQQRGPRVDAERMQILMRGKAIDVSDAELQIARRLIDASGGWISGKLLAASSGSRPDQIVKKLNKKLKLADARIESNSAKGYRWTKRVTRAARAQKARTGHVRA